MEQVLGFIIFNGLIKGIKRYVNYIAGNYIEVRNGFMQEVVYARKAAVDVGTVYYFHDAVTWVFSIH
jgi:hypothetical protein